MAVKPIAAAGKKEQPESNIFTVYTNTKNNNPFSAEYSNTENTEVNKKLSSEYLDQDYINALDNAEKYCETVFYETYETCI